MSKATISKVVIRLPLPENRVDTIKFDLNFKIYCGSQKKINNSMLCIKYVFQYLALNIFI